MEPLKYKTQVRGVGFEVVPLQRLPPGTTIQCWCYSLTEPTEAQEVYYSAPPLPGLPGHWTAGTAGPPYGYLTLADLLLAILPPAFWEAHPE